MEVEHCISQSGKQEWKIKFSNELHREDGPAVIWPNGDQEWWLNGQLHREDGPAIIFDKDGIGQAWFINDMRHRVDGPAVVTAEGHQEWWINGLRHRENGPAIITDKGHQEWFINGKRHRVDGPAIMYAPSDGGGQEWWLNGRLHREDGPAIIRRQVSVWFNPENKVHYYINGTKIKEEIYDSEIHDKFIIKSGGKTKAASREYY